MTERDLSNQFVEAINAPETESVFLIFATIDHPKLENPIRVVGDVVDYVYGGNTYTGIPFNLEILTDTEDIPRGVFSMQNVDRIIGEAINGIVTSPRLKLEVVSSDDFDLTVEPRVESASPVTPEYVADYLQLKNIRVDVMKIEADIISFDVSVEPWPFTRTTKDRLPGLYR